MQAAESLDKAQLPWFDDPELEPADFQIARVLGIEAQIAFSDCSRLGDCVRIAKHSRPGNGLYIGARLGHEETGAAVRLQVVGMLREMADQHHRTSGMIGEVRQCRAIGITGQFARMRGECAAARCAEQLASLSAAVDVHRASLSATPARRLPRATQRLSSSCASGRSAFMPATWLAP